MKIVVRLVLGVIALLGVGLVALVLLLPSVVASEAVRAEIGAAAGDALGRELRFEKLELAYFPLSLVVVQPVIEGEREGDAPFLEADAISLELSLLPLLVRAIVVDTLVVERGIVRLVRTEQGIALPGPVEEGAGEAPPEPGGTAAGGPPVPGEPAADGEPGFQLAVRELELRRTRVVFDDLASQPPTSWVVDPIDAKVVGTSPSAPVELRATASLESGGTLRVTGTATLDGELDLELTLAELIVDPVSAYLGDDVALAGALDGVVVVKGPAASPLSVGLDLTLAETRVDVSGTAISGVVALEAELERPVEALAGHFRLDAGGAELRSGDAFVKPRGTDLTLEGRIESGQDGALHFEDLELVLHQLTARSRVALGDTTRVAETHASTPLAGWKPLIPALAGMRLSGQARIEDLELVLEPLAVRGRLEIEDGSVQLPDSAPISFHGAIVATGEALRGEGIAVGTAEQELAIGLEIRELFGSLLLDFEARAEDLDSNRVVTALAGAPDRVEGPLDFEMELDGPLGGDGELLSSLRGRLDVSIDDGRIVGFSPLRVVFDQVGGLGSAGLELSRVFLGESVQEYYGDDFERASVALRLANGIVHDEVGIHYRGYTVDLEGTVDASTRELDNTGRIVIAGELDAIIARGLGARGYEPRARSIPLASVTGRLYDPRIELAQPETLAFVTTYAQDLYGATAQKIIESEVSKQLGDAAGKALGDAAGDLLGDLFGGGSNPKKR